MASSQRNGVGGLDTQAHTWACKHMGLERQGQEWTHTETTGTHHTLLAHVAARPELPVGMSFVGWLVVLLQTQSQALLSPQPWMCLAGWETPQPQGCPLCWAFGAQSCPEAQGLGQQILRHGLGYS